MKKKDAKVDNEVDSFLKELYTRAKTSQHTCPNCGHNFTLGGDFSEMAKALDLIIKYEAIKGRKGPDIPSFFEREEE